MKKIEVQIFPACEKSNRVTFAIRKYSSKAIEYLVIPIIFQ